MRNLPLRLASLCLCLAPSLVDPVFAQGRSGEAGAERQVDREVDRRVELQVERQVSANAERQVDQQIQRGMEQQLDRQLGAQVQGRVDRQIENRAGRTVTGAPVHNRPAMTDGERGPGAAIAASAAAPARGASVSDGEIDRHFVFATDAQGFLYLKNQRLMLVDAATLTALDQRGVGYKRATALSGLNKVMIELDDIDAAALSELQGLPVGVIPLDEVNHLYRYESAGSTKTAVDASWFPHEAAPLEATAAQQNAVRLGLIDSAIEKEHVSLQRTQLTSLSFVDHGLLEPISHGTAIASILAGESGDFRGLLPRAQVYAASVFYYSTEHGDHATTKSILLALDWLVQKRVTVINMSLSGPHNPLLQQAVAEVIRQGIFVVAAAGNGGPGAAPAYPAAYPEVVAVTALTRDDNAYFQANHGAYIDFAAPGVGITAASGKDDFTEVSGTSFAVPFVAAILALAGSGEVAEQTVQRLQNHAVDLGKPGVDNVFGYGKIALFDGSKSASYK